MAALPSDLHVVLDGVKHKLVKATPFAKWAVQPAAVPTDPPTGMKCTQAFLDVSCGAGGLGTDYLRSVDNIFGLAHLPAHAAGMFDAWVTLGGLDLDRVYKDVDQWVTAVVAAKSECGLDPRLLLDATAFYPCEPRSSGGPGSAAARLWMYKWSGDMVLGADDGDSIAMAYLRAGASPFVVSAGRDLSSDNFCRFLNSLRSVASSRSDYFKDVLASSATLTDEIAEYVADSWKQMVSTGYPFKLDGRIPQRNMEVEAASAMAFGSQAQKDAASQRIFVDSIQAQPNIIKCIKSLRECNTWLRSLTILSSLQD